MIGQVIWKNIEVIDHLKWRHNRGKCIYDKPPNIEDKNKLKYSRKSRFMEEGGH